MRTSKEVTDLASRLQSLEHSYKQLEQITFDVKSSASDWKNKYHELKQSAENVKSSYPDSASIYTELHYLHYYYY